MSEVEERDGKRRRLDDPCGGGSLIITNLPDDLLKACLSFVGPGNYLYVAETCHKLNEQYTFRKETTWKNAAISVSCAKLCLQDAPAKDKEKVLLFLQQAAVYNGNTRVLQWMMDYHSCLPGKNKLAVAGERGHVNVLEWAEANNLAWMSQDLCFAASSNGHVHILKWIHRRCPEETKYWQPQRVARHAARRGHISILRWLHGLNLLPDNLYAYAYWGAAISENQILVLDWLVENRFKVRENTAIIAARFGQIEVLAWAKGQGGIAWTEDVCSGAATNGHLDALKWLREHDCPWDGETIEVARENGYLHVVEWARENGCPEPPPFEAA